MRLGEVQRAVRSTNVREEWAEIVIPQVSLVDRQFIGCLIPIDNQKIGFITRATRTFREMGACPVSLVTKPLGKVNRRCLSVTFYLRCPHSPDDLDLEADSLGEVIEHLFGIPYTIIQILSTTDAKLRLE